MKAPDAESIMERKRKVAFRAAEMVTDGMVIGLGTGSTVSFAIQRLGERTREGLRFQAVPTSFQTEMLARRSGIRLVSMEEVEELDLAIDGADQVDRLGRMLKGRGGAHTREKCVAEMAKRLVIAITAEKLRETLDGVVPVEVIPFAHAYVGREIGRMGASVFLREGDGKDGPVITDNGNFVLDCNFGRIEDPCNLERALNEITGVVENGIFSRYPKKTVVVIGGAEGIRLHSY